ncbi:serine/threonine-protein kinase [Kamptonema formosum]|uniref:serine/threonine-protein kinase n=1 Tax=Kamptonema formosum TaxID=331992 RepID=UPI0003455BF8|nr:serine/threonine-protein kinase [Oscillatoria sp. PCC 10802]
MIQPGLVLQNRYCVVRPLGKGGFGHIFEVDDRGAPKVLKVLNLEKFCDPKTKEKAISLFQREAEVLRLLNHPGIPKVKPDGYFTATVDAGTLHCLVMEKIDGQNLEEWIANSENHPPLREEQALDWLKQLAGILHELHRHRYFHRDIKPSNIMLKPDGQLVLIDFGTVREVTNTYLLKIGDQEVTGLFSVGYAPVEQLKGKAVPQSDFHALGRTFVHLLTGKHPDTFPLNDMTGELIWREAAIQVSPALADLIDSLMAIFPHERPQNTQAILQRLANLEPGRAQDPPRQRNSKQNRLKFGFGLAGLLLLGFTGIQFAFPQLARRLNALGVENHLANKPGEASSDIKWALKLDPDNTGANYNKGILCEQVLNFDCARSHYQKAALLGSAAAYSQLSRLYIRHDKNFDAAADLLQKGLQLVRDDRVKYSLIKNLGWARLGQGRYAEAKEHLQAAIQLDSRRVSAHCLLAQVLEAQGETQTALAEWEICRQYADKSKPDEDLWYDLAQQRLAARF